MSKRKSKKDDNLSESDQDSDSETDKSDANDKKSSKLKKKHKRRHETSSDSDTDSDSDSSSDSDDDGGHRKRSKNKKHKKTKKSKKHKKQREEHKSSSSTKKEIQPPAPASGSSDEGGGGGGGGDRARYNKKPPIRGDDKKYLTAPIVHVDENWDNSDDGGDHPPPPPPESKQPRSMSSDRVKHDDSKWDRSPEQRRDDRPKYVARPFNRDYRGEMPTQRDPRRSRSNEPRRRPDYEHRDDRGGGGGDRGGGRFSNFNRRDDFNHRGGGRGGRGGWGNRGFQDRGGGGGGGRFNNHFNDGDRRQDNWQNKPFENRRFQNDRFQNDRFQNDRYQNDRYPNKDQHHPGDRDRRDFNKPDRRDDFRRQRNDDRDGRNNDRGERDFREPRNNERNHSYQRDEERDRKPFRRFKQEKDEGEYEWGGGDRKPSRASPSQERRSKRGSRERSVEKERPNFGLSGKLTEDTNKVNGVVIKYSEPQEARKPKRRWRLYPFKGEETLPTMYIHRQSCYLIGRDRKVCDLPVDHPSCSKQHAVLQYRLVPFTRDDGSMGKRVRPYIIDLESANGTFLNNKKIEPKKYIEIMEKDVLKFGFSSREYVMLHENSKEDQEDDDVAVD